MLIKPPLFDACYYGNEIIVEYLIDHSANLNKSSLFDKTPLIVAFREINKEIIKYN